MDSQIHEQVAVCRKSGMEGKQNETKAAWTGSSADE